MSEDAVDLACVVCSATSNLKRCTRCRNRVYCSRDHQILDWKTHKLTCTKAVTNTDAPNAEQHGDRLKTFTSSQTQPQTGPTCVNDSNNIGKDESKNECLQVNELSSTLQKENSKDKMSSSVNNILDENDQVPFDDRKFKKSVFDKPDSFQFDKLAEFVVEHMKKDGLCVLDGFFENKILQQVLKEIKSLDENGELKQGQLSGGRTSGDDSLKVTKAKIRSDRIIWIQGNEEKSSMKNLCQVIEKMDLIVAHFNDYLEDNLIEDRTKAMVACYPGNGSFYRRHIDNPKKDGRLITAILYLNSEWNVEVLKLLFTVYGTPRDAPNINTMADQGNRQRFHLAELDEILDSHAKLSYYTLENGGLLRIFPTDRDDYIDVEPLFNRLLFFWSDRRNPHEVQPAYRTRYAITIWFFDQYERKLAKEEEVNAELENVKEQIKQTEIKVKEMEKKALEQRIENEATRAVNALTQDELVALALMTREHPNPSQILSELGVDPTIQTSLLRLLREKHIVP